MKSQKVMMRFDEVCARDKYALRRIEGTATPGSMIRLISIADLKANPREAKVGDVTEEIEESLEKTPKLFHFKTKGILLAAARSWSKPSSPRSCSGLRTRGRARPTVFRRSRRLLSSRTTKARRSCLKRTATSRWFRRRPRRCSPPRSSFKP